MEGNIRNNKVMTTKYTIFIIRGIFMGLNGSLFITCNI